MSSLGGQWRALRHYLSSSGAPELERLLRRLRPAGADQWHDVLSKIEKTLWSRVHASNVKELDNRSAPSSSSSPSDTAQVEHETKEANAKEAKPVEMKPAEDKAKTMEAKRDEVDPEETKPEENKSVFGLGELSMQGLLQGLRLTTALHRGKLTEPSWKDKKPLLNKCSLKARTAYLVSAVRDARSDEALARRAADLLQHLLRQPDAAALAAAAGALPALLRAQDRAAGEAAEALRESLALLGWVGPPRGAGARVLAIDGGGVRGLVAVRLLRELERRAGRDARDLFDVVVGVSTGAIVAAGVGGGARLEAVGAMYRELAARMFATGALGGGARLLWSHGYYDTAAWERLLRARLGERRLSAARPPLALVSCAVSAGRHRPHVFRSYAPPAAALWQAVRASAAAPTYFAEFHHDGLVHQDGGIAANNPCGIAVREAKRLFAARELAHATVVSVGCGRAPPPPPPPPRAAPAPATSWRDKFGAVLDAATDTEAVHALLQELLPPGQYFRLNPALPAAVDMDETDPARLDEMLDATERYVRRNARKLEHLAARLARPRPAHARLRDLLHRRALIHGLARR